MDSSDDDEKLRIALETLMELLKHSSRDRDDDAYIQELVEEAFREIRRRHYIINYSSAVYEMLVGLKRL